MSFGFYRRTMRNSGIANVYGLTTPFTPQIWNGWYFGVNYRIKCQQAAHINNINVQYSDLIAGGFIANDWILIPHYVNNHNDQGVDFFKWLTPATILVNHNYTEAFADWKNQRIIEIGMPNIVEPNFDIPIQLPSLDTIIAEAKSLL